MQSLAGEAAVAIAIAPRTEVEERMRVAMLPQLLAAMAMVVLTAMEVMQMERCG